MISRFLLSMEDLCMHLITFGFGGLCVSDDEAGLVKVKPLPHLKTRLQSDPRQVT